MKITIDARMYNESGIGRYIRNLLFYLQKIDKKNEYVILHLKKDYERLTYKDNFSKVLADFKWYGFEEQYKLPRILSNINPDLTHFPHFNVPIFFSGKFVVTIHDLIHQHFQMRRATTHDPILYKIKNIGYNQVFKHAVSKCLKVYSPSKYIKDALIGEWGMKEDKIIITPEAADELLISYMKNILKQTVDSTLKKFSVKVPFIFYVGNAHPHKNVEGLIRAFLNIRKKYQYLTLVLSGNDHYFWQKIRKEYSHKDIVYTGYITDEELVAFYKTAQVFVMPSFEEGFGIPLLEAFAAGCPVVSSDAGSLKEVGRDAAIYFNPKGVKDMEKKIEQVINDKRLRSKLIEKGQTRCKLFSWEKLARQTLEGYLQCG